MNKICTSIEQSKKLIELGIDVNSADMIHNIFDEPYIRHDTPIDKYHTPAWSLSALLKLIPTPTLSTINNRFCCETNEFSSKYYNEPVDATFEMVCWLLENKKLF